MEGELLSQVQGSLRDLLNDLLSTHNCDESLNDTLEQLILGVGDTQRSARKLEGDILGRHGIGTQLATAQRISTNVSTALTLLEDVLLANMEGNLSSLFERECLLYQKSPDVSYKNAVLHHLDDRSR